MIKTFLEVGKGKNFSLQEDTGGHNNGADLIQKWRSWLRTKLIYSSVFQLKRTLECIFRFLKDNLTGQKVVKKNEMDVSP